MRLDELNEDEVGFLASLCNLVANADKVRTPEEAAMLQSIGIKVGLDRWIHHLISGELLPADLTHEAALVKRPEARTLILETVEALAASDDVHPEETRIIDLVKSAWVVRA